jgi:hypothetical protein
MRPRDGVLVYKETQSSDASTKTIDLDLVDPVTALYIEAEAVNGTTSNEDNFISDALTKIEIVDGSEILAMLTMHELEAMHFYKLGKVPVLFPSEWASGTQRHGAYLLFGRRLYDPEYAIDFTKFKNPQLKLTWNLAAMRTIDTTTSFATGTLKLTAVAKIMEGMSPPGKYLMDKELLSFTSSSTSGAEERKELPTDLVFRMLMTRHYVEPCEIDYITSDLKLTADADKFVAFNRKVKQLDAEALSRFGDQVILHPTVRATGGVVRGLTTKETHYRFWPSISTQFTDFVHTLEFSGAVTLETQTPAGGSAGTRRLWSEERGHALHGTLPLPFGDMDDPASWFDPTTFKKLELIFTSGGTAGSCAIVAEQVRPN